jgi:hypothetical protein
VSTTSAISSSPISGRAKGRKGKALEGLMTVFRKEFSGGWPHRV